MGCDALRAATALGSLAPRAWLLGRGGGTGAVRWLASVGPGRCLLRPGGDVAWLVTDLPLMIKFDYCVLRFDHPIGYDSTTTW